MLGEEPEDGEASREATKAGRIWQVVYAEEGSIGTCEEMGSPNALEPLNLDQVSDENSKQRTHRKPKGGELLSGEMRCIFT